MLDKHSYEKLTQLSSLSTDCPVTRHVLLDDVKAINDVTNDDGSVHAIYDWFIDARDQFRRVSPPEVVNSAAEHFKNVRVGQTCPVRKIVVD